MEGLATTNEPNEVLCRMSLDIDGILHVAAIEKRTGKSKHITIANATQAKSGQEIEAARRRITELYSSREADFDVTALDDDSPLTLDVPVTAEPAGTRPSPIPARATRSSPWTPAGWSTAARRWS